MGCLIKKECRCAYVLSIQLLNLNDKNCQTNHACSSYFKITNKSPPDITLIRMELLELLEFITEAYEGVFGEIDNSLNINWILYKLLQIVDFKCNREDFFCLKTSTKEDSAACPV